MWIYKNLELEKYYFFNRNLQFENWKYVWCLNPAVSLSTGLVDLEVVNKGRKAMAEKTVRWDWKNIKVF